MNKHHTWVLPVIVFSQFCCTSLWFAGNAVMSNLTANYDLSASALGHITSAVQFGFIAGTLAFAIYTIADRFSPSRVFFISAVAGALFNLAAIIDGQTFIGLLITRFLTGFFLAGIYPVGMKIAADYYQKGLGKSLGYLVGALVVGTAFPHLINNFANHLPWKTVLIFTSSLAILGGLLMVALVPNGPFRKRSESPDFSAWFNIFKNIQFRAAAFGYFGHMWELYAFWAFVPIMLATYGELHAHTFNIPFLSFLIIGLGGVACVLGGHISAVAGAKRTAASALLLSGVCCLTSPLFFIWASPSVFVGFLVFWGLVVIADSPLFSSLVAQSARDESKATALTITNCIGFAITILSIQLLNVLLTTNSPYYLYMILALGPIFGLVALFTTRTADNAT